MDKEQLTEWLELIIAWVAKIPLLPIFILCSIIGLGIGMFMIINPSLAIEIQRKFYCHINWKIEPISMSLEIRNTRIIGCLLIILLVAIIYFVFTAGLLSP